MKFQETRLKGSYLIDHDNHKDERGFFDRVFCQKTFQSFLKKKNICQINRSFTKKEGTVRGLHFQYPPYAEIKIVSCLKGKVWDVAIDVRKGSPTFMEYHAVTLSEDSSQSFFIPEGFAHGFQTLTNDCEMLYFHTADYNSNAEGALNTLDQRLRIQWPKKITEQSERDINHPMLSENFLGLNIL
jgi:dTDP-4-dehydrorhamnose 3,5-epimerase